MICDKQTLALLLAVELTDTVRPMRSSVNGDAVKSTAAARANFPIVKISAKTNVPSDVLRQKLIADYRLVKAGPLPEGLA